MRTMLVVYVAIAASLPAPSFLQAADDVRPITEAETVLAIYVENWGRASLGAPKLIVAVWGDGQAVWSEDHVHGGAPYRAGRVDRQKLTALVAHMRKDGYFSNQKLARAHFGPDSHFTSILIKSRKQQLKMRSWHELFEANGKTVATSSGIEPLAGRRRLEVLARENADYLHFRLVWAEARLLISSLLPRKSAAHKGEIVMKAGKMSWHTLGME